MKLRNLLFFLIVLIFMACGAKKGGFTKFFFTVSYLGKFQIQHHATGREIVKGVKSLTGFWLNDTLQLRGTFELNQFNGPAIQALAPNTQPTHIQQD